MLMPPSPRPTATVGKKMRIPGFRKGNAPRPVVDNYVGRDHVLAEATEAVLNDFYRQGRRSEGFAPSSHPRRGARDRQQGEDFTFEADVVTRPELHARERGGYHIEITPREVTDAELDAQIEELRERFASLEPVEDRDLPRMTSPSSRLSATSMGRPTRATKSTSICMRWAANSCPRSLTKGFSAWRRVPRRTLSSRSRHFFEGGVCRQDGPVRCGHPSSQGQEASRRR